MKDEHLFHPKEAADALGVSVKTIQRWEQAGKLRAVRTAGNQRRLPLKEIERQLRPGEPQAERCALYARVSSVRQERDGNLAKQIEQLKEAASARSYEVVAVITEQTYSLSHEPPHRMRGLANRYLRVEVHKSHSVQPQHPIPSAGTCGCSVGEVTIPSDASPV